MNLGFAKAPCPGHIQDAFLCEKEPKFEDLLEVGGPTNFQDNILFGHDDSMISELSMIKVSRSRKPSNHLIAD